ncbi:hypothetical protein PENTCL1PPCAC_23670, partial [Pristionchus entomophagus]
HMFSNIGDGQYQCHFPNCDKIFATTSSRARHKKIHIGTKYKCDSSNCSKSYTDPSSLWRHKRQRHRSQPINHNTQMTRDSSPDDDYVPRPSR